MESSQSSAPVDNPAYNAKSFFYTYQSAVLSTHSHSVAGYPFGSVIPYLIDEDNSVIIYVSLIAEHYKNISRNSHACLTVSDPFGLHDPQAFGRVSALVDFVPVEDLNRARIERAYLEKFPASIHYEIAHNFLFLRGTIKRVRWIGGFAKIAWIEEEEFRISPYDPLAPFALDIIDHMNHDHHEALIEIVRARAPQHKNPRQVRMSSITSDQMSILFRDGEDTGTLIMGFEHAATTVDQARHEVIAVLDSCRTS